MGADTLLLYLFATLSDFFAPKLYRMYVKEFALFKELLYNPQEVELMPVWNRLENPNK
jgi:hypothetical protein